ncbi:MAG: four-helix bundle copper-binding protein [Chloroflexi bacterium]|nr:four-helix bundle copper-binding protein [Chloroflexota bacterium]
MPHMPGHQAGPNADLHSGLEECINSCWQTLSYCLDKGGQHVQANHMRLLMDCAEICETADDYLMRNSAITGRITPIVADVCERTAQSLNQFRDDPQMQNCVDACQRTAEVSRRTRMAA